MEKSWPKFLVIGTGFIFPRHEQAIKEIGGEIIEKVNDDNGPQYWKEALANTKADYVSICTPNDLHFEMVKMANDLGKKVICEKPLAIKVEHIKELAKRKNIFTVLQLRHHPLVKELKANLEPNKRHDVEMDIAVYRDKNYFEIWKGQTVRSGGVLYNLGVHYFDLMIYLFGMPEKFNTEFLNDKTGQGTMENDKFFCKWRVSVDEQPDKQRRVFRIDGRDYNFSSKDNLSYEDLHKYVYMDLMQGKGVTPKEQVATTELIAHLSQKI